MVANKFKQMVQDEGAVSPVIGVILMVAVTVVLGAVIGAFVFGIGDKLGEPAPNAQLDFAYDASGTSLTVYHDGGASITGENTGELQMTGDITASGAVSSGSAYTAGDVLFGSGGVADISGNSLTSSQSVEVHWVSNGGDQSSTLGSFQAP